MAVEFVTTQGLTRYERTCVSELPTAKKRGIVASTNVSRQRLLPLPSSSVSASTPRAAPIASSTLVSVENGVPVCSISISMIKPELIAHYELLRNNRGELKYVQRSTDGRFFDVNYWNARLNKSIPLGRFTDELMASLAHAVARADESRYNCRIVPFAAQEHLVNLYTNDGQGGPSSSDGASGASGVVATRPESSAATQASTLALHADDMDLDFNALFSLLEDSEKVDDF